MRLTEALRIVQQAPADAAPFSVTLACGFTPIHLKTFLTAHLQNALPARRVVVEPGLYGNLIGTIENAAYTDLQAIAVPLEWSDLDQRLGYRQAGGWGPDDVSDIVAHAGLMLQRLESAIRRVPSSTKVAISLPTLSLPPVFLNPGWQAGEAEMRLDESLAAFAANAASLGNVALVSRRHLDETSPRADRFDLKSELTAGLSYTVSHTDHVAAALARLIAPFVPKKGLITDLDDTLWQGLVGEVGAAGVSWDLEHHSQIHGLYQQVLRALAEQGVLLAIASKNNADIAEPALARPDILLPADKLFPHEIHWQPKSGSVARILKTWNVGADSVVFVDDSPMEIAEVQAAHPAVECIRFPKDDYPAIPAFLRKLRDLFGKAKLSEEDTLRLESIRRGAQFAEAAEGATPDAFLEQMKAAVKFDFTGAAADPRALELVNKTNQFNLNGRRYSETDWAKDLGDANTFVASIAYEDKFGALGKIAVMRGRRDGRAIQLASWVISCRAFARRIEFQCLRVLFEKFGAESIDFEYEATPKNEPLREFFSEMLGQTPPAPPLRLTKAAFAERCPPLYHTVSQN